MDNNNSLLITNEFDISEIYHQFCDIWSQNDHARSREGLPQLLKSVESRGQTMDSIFHQLSKLMSKLDFMVDACKFTCFYDFVFFMCRENGQKNITVSRAIDAWRLALTGRFRLLYQWCDFIKQNRRHNISEDTWQQVLAFSRCVHEDLEGYDSKGAWPVVIDDFADYMCRNTRSYCCKASQTTDCNYGSFQTQACLPIDGFRGLGTLPGSKRKPTNTTNCTIPETLLDFKKICLNDKICTKRPALDVVILDNYTETVKHCHNSTGRLNNSVCSVEGSLSKGFAGLFSKELCLQKDTCMQYGQQRRNSYT